MSLVEGLLNQTVDYVYSVSKDGYGDITRTQVYTNLPCRWQLKNNRVRNKDNEEIFAKVEMWVDPSYTINEDYEVKVGSEYYVVKSKYTAVGLDGTIDHYKYYLV